MKTYKCEEMMCDGCVKRIKNGLSAEGIGHEVDLSSVGRKRYTLFYVIDGIEIE